MPTAPFSRTCLLGTCDVAGLRVLGLALRFPIKPWGIPAHLRWQSWNGSACWVQSSKSPAASTTPSPPAGASAAANPSSCGRNGLANCGGANSDPVMYGFAGRSFNFIGEVGKFYNIISTQNLQVTRRSTWPQTHCRPQNLCSKHQSIAHTQCTPSCITYSATPVHSLRAILSRHCTLPRCMAACLQISSTCMLAPHLGEAAWQHSWSDL